MKAQKVLFLICFILFLNLSFAINDYYTRMPFIEDCFDVNGIVNEDCLNYSLPRDLSDCNLISQNIENYEFLLTKCYAHEKSCDSLKLDQTYKDSCFDQSNACEKIVDQDKKNLCINKVNKTNFDSQIKNIITFILLALYLLSPLGIILIIIKTIFDLIKKNKFSIAKRVTLIILLFLIWFFIVITACFPPCYILY